MISAQPFSVRCWHQAVITLCFRGYDRFPFMSLHRRGTSHGSRKLVKSGSGTVGYAQTIAVLDTEVQAGFLKLFCPATAKTSGFTTVSLLPGGGLGPAIACGSDSPPNLKVEGVGKRFGRVLSDRRSRTGKQPTCRLYLFGPQCYVPLWSAGSTWTGSPISTARLSCQATIVSASTS